MSKSHRRFGKYKDAFDTILKLCDGIECNSKKACNDQCSGIDGARLIRYEVEKVYKKTVEEKKNDKIPT